MEVRRWDGDLKGGERGEGEGGREGRGGCAEADGRMEDCGGAAR